MRKTAVALTVLLSACASAPTPSDTSGWRGKTLAIARHSPSSLQIVGTLDEIMIGATSGTWNPSAGRGAQVIAENGIEDPVVHVADALFVAAAEHYGVVAALEVAAPNLANPADLVSIGQGRDLLLEVTGGSTVAQRLFSRRYSVGSTMDARLIDVRAGKAFRDSFCQNVGDGDLTSDELMADHARRLKLILARQADTCLAKFKVEILGIDAKQP
jgi:hypothetical protein